MPYQDFRQFLDVLRQHGELIDVNRPVALNLGGAIITDIRPRKRPHPQAGGRGLSGPAHQFIRPYCWRRHLTP